MLIVLFILFILMFVFGIICLFGAFADAEAVTIIFGAITLFLFSAGIVSTITYWGMT